MTRLVGLLSLKFTGKLAYLLEVPREIADNECYSRHPVIALVICERVNL